MNYLFVDTNILLHYRRLEEIDWCSHLNSKEVKIVLCPVVIRELDKHKTNHPQKKIRKRAQELIADLHARLTGAKTAPNKNGVPIEFLAEEPTFDFELHKLRSDLPDDWLIATSLTWKQDHPTDAVHIVSADLGIAIKAKSKGVSVFTPADTDKLPEELEADEKKMLQLQSELAEIKNKIPKLTLYFWDEKPEKNLKNIQLKQPTSFDSDASKSAMAKIQADFPIMEISSKASHKNLGPFEKLQRQLAGEYLVPITEADVNQYNKNLAAFYKEFEVYFQKMHKFQAREALTVHLEIGLDNAGNTPAEDVDIHLHFPDGFQLFDGDEYAAISPQKPEPPIKPGTIVFNPPRFPELPNFGPRLSGPPPNISSPSINRTNSYDVRSHVNKAKHGYLLRVAKFVVVFENYQSAGSFRIDYSISAANLPKAIDSHLSVVVEKV